MKRLIPLALILAGCTSTGDLTPQGQQIVGAVCGADAVGQPIAVTVVPTLLPQATPAAAMDAALVHPAVVAACAKYGAAPSAVTVAPVAAPAVKASAGA